LADFEVARSKGYQRFLARYQKIRSRLDVEAVRGCHKMRRKENGI